MKKTYYIVLFPSALLVCFLIFAAKKIISQNRPSISEEEKIQIIQIGDGNMLSSDSKKKEQKDNSSNPSGKQDLVTEKEAVQTAFIRASRRSTCDTKAPPLVELVDDYYLITFWAYDDPFRMSTKVPDSKIKVHMTSGQASGMQVGFGGVNVFSGDPKTKPGETKEEKTENQMKMRDALLELTNRAKRGQELGNKPTTTTVASHVALENARQHAKFRNRNYDTVQEPQVILVNDVYVVVLWRNADLITKNGPTYDSRIGVDAFSGEVIGMEITRYKKPAPR